MRLGSRTPDEFIQLLNKKNEIIQHELLSKILELTKTVNVKVMMGDSTITEQKTFDPKQVMNYLEEISKKLTDWSLQDVSITNNEENRKLAKYRNGEDFLREHKLDTTLAFCTSLSDTMHVCRERNGDGTLLSSIWDLKEGVINLYFYHDYNYSIQYNLKEELVKGDHIIKIPKLFPANSEFKRLTSYITPFNTPFIRILLVFIGGFFFMTSLFFFINFLK